MQFQNKLPTIIITGASGFIGRYLLEQVLVNYNVIAIGRRSPNEIGISYHPNLHWMQWDIANNAFFNQALGYIIGKGGAEYLIHLAGYYDFTYKGHPEYERTNVEGTKLILEMARRVNIKHFIFVSSLAACRFIDKNESITEQTPPDADFDYAISKAKGEQLVQSYSKYYKCSVVRLAAVFSDWCEYAPLYKFLITWLSKKWDSRILAGKGESAVSYIHVHDLIKMFKTIIEKSPHLPQFDIYCASPDGSTSHKELYQIATRDYFGQQASAVYLNKILAYPGIIIRKILGKLGIIPEPFEQLWMVKYIDAKLHIDSYYTRNALGWEPTPRYHIIRRLLFLLVNMKSHNFEWEVKNEVALKHASHRPNLKIYEQLLLMQDSILKKLENQVLSEKNVSLFSNYRLMDKKEFEGYLSKLYFLIMASVRSSDRSIMIHYIDDIAVERFASGFDCEEVTALLYLTNDIAVDELLSNKEMQKYKQEIYDYIGLTIQLAIDEMEEIFENLEHQLTPERLASLKSLKDKEARSRMIEKLSSFYQDTHV